MAQKVSPHRRRSVAVLNQGERSRHSTRRRAYSIAPGEKLSPAAKAHRSLKPRKSILKAPVDADSAELGDDTTSMDLTEVNSRRSLSRRVSFAPAAHVRLFDTKDKDAAESQNPDATDSGKSRARRRSSLRTRSSVAFSEYGERSMDMDTDDTALAPQDFLNIRMNADAVAEDPFSDDEEDDIDGDMEITEAIRMKIERKSSLSFDPKRNSLPIRRRSSAIPTTSTQGQSENQPPPLHHRRSSNNRHEDAQDNDQDLTTSSNQSHSYTSEGTSGEYTQPMEFTVPISQPLRPPAPPSEAWLQLRAMTHSGDEPYEPPPEDSEDDGSGVPIRYDLAEGEPMELTVAMGRLLEARPSLGMSPLPPAFISLSGRAHDQNATEAERSDIQEDSFTSTENSFADSDDGNRTINVTKLRASLGGQESSMDITAVISRTNVVAESPASAEVVSSESPAQPTITASEATTTTSADSQDSTQHVFHAPETVRPKVFNNPEVRTPAPHRSPSKVPLPTVPKPFTFSRPRPSTSTNGPVATASPARVPQSPAAHWMHRGTAAFAPPSVRKSPMKRPVPEDESTDQRPSPSKRMAVAKLQSSQQVAGTPQDRAARRSSAVRRPSGYFAQRKSMGASNVPAPIVVATATVYPDASKEPTMPGAEPEQAQTSPDSDWDLMGAPGADIADNAPLYPDVERIVRETPPTPLQAMFQDREETATCEREASRQAVASPTPTRGSPSPRKARVASPASTPVQALADGVSPRIPSTVPFPMSSISTHLRHTGIPVSQSSSGYSGSVVTEKVISPKRSGHSTATEKWREEVQDEDAASDDEGPPISIEQFFAMTGIRFMDELTMPKPRQSVVPPPQLRSRGRRRSSIETSADDEEDEIPLAEFSVAMAVELPRLELYTAVANDLSAWIEESKKICLQVEKETEKDTPELFKDFVEADETEKGILLHQLKLIKANNYGTAKFQWYEWKMDWTKRLYGRAQQEFTNLETDAQALAKVIKQAQEMLPDLREEFAQVMSELEQEQADIAEIDNSDQKFLADLKASVAEQDHELELFRSDVSENRAKLQRMEEKQAELEQQKQEIAAAISQTEHVLRIQRESTSVTVSRLRDELEALQNLHLWQATRITADLAESIYASRYLIRIPCKAYEPIPLKITVTRMADVRTRERDSFPRFTDFGLRMAQRIVSNADKQISIRQIVEMLSDFWSSCSQLRTQFTFLAVKYPLSVEVDPKTEAGPPGLVAKATVLFPSARGKAAISFRFSEQTLSRWPLSIASLVTDVEVAYGRIERDVILNAVRRRLDQASPVDNHGCLLDACIEATEQYE
ncbi:uncharacterized protein LAESUDRAFT_679813 [Laetiporus sulphureus 93-53]|uniref:Spc7 kinetochore protein domain-containing protein n=1 Tax=Laetiporus sulphureus 93-53 TaxID=1314785 RepID=A0A165E5U7_9APHY|nr:uncharacterized protein LAESUDRAFT_679813 [Laetiporus sulphureus 93-53]KZT06294.1 hypothetical protein LAESUDRAFT_679813 [Laetiporus sulphureus 93-53]